jgi:hypothetical protein
MTSLVAGLAVLGLVAIGCGGGSNEEETATGGLTLLAPGPGLSIREAIDSEEEGPLLVNGFLVVSDGEVRLCESLAESSPPVCAGASLAVEAFDFTGLEGLESAGDVTWSSQAIQVIGSVQGDTLNAASDILAWR